MQHGALQIRADGTSLLLGFRYQVKWIFKQEAVFAVRAKQHIRRQHVFNGQEFF